MLKIKKLSENAMLPTLGSKFAAGYDLYSTDTTCIGPGETQLIHTGIVIELENGFWGGIYARSGLATKRGLRPANCVGVIDSDYRGEIMVALHNHSDEERTVEDGERVAQLVIAPYVTADFVVCDELDDTVRGEGGFGSTGRK